VSRFAGNRETGRFEFAGNRGKPYICAENETVSVMAGVVLKRRIYDRLLKWKQGVSAVLYGKCHLMSDCYGKVPVENIYFIDISGCPAVLGMLRQGA
jgi:hypothetical protein